MWSVEVQAKYLKFSRLSLNKQQETSEVWLNILLWFAIENTAGFETSLSSTDLKELLGGKNIWHLAHCMLLFLNPYNMYVPCMSFPHYACPAQTDLWQWCACMYQAPLEIISHWWLTVTDWASLIDLQAHIWNQSLNELQNFNFAMTLCLHMKMFQIQHAYIFS